MTTVAVTVFGLLVVKLYVPIAFITIIHSYQLENMGKAFKVALNEDSFTSH